MAESQEPQNNNQLVVVSVTTTEDMAVRAVNKRYEGLTTVRTKAIKGKGAWYWAHLEPILVRNPDTDDPKAVKLRCNLCEAVFSASNPSRTASEHLKRGTCPNFNSVLKPSSSSSSLPPLCSPSDSNRKRFSPIGTSSLNNYYHSQQQQQQHLLLSGGKEDLGPLAMLEDSVKKLKSVKPMPPGPQLTKPQIDSALSLLTDWFYESYGSVSFTSLDHPKFKAFLNQVGLPPDVSRHDYLSSRLDSMYEEAKTEAEVKIRDAEFYQLVSDGWKSKMFGNEQEGLVKFMVNLPNGTTLFQKAFFPGGSVGSVGSVAVPAAYAEEIMWETVTGTCNVAKKCVGIVADKYKAKSLRNLELRNHWMVNLSCQLQGVGNLIKDFSKGLPLFKIVIDNCLKIASLFYNNSQARSILNKFRSQESRFSVSFGAAPLLYCDNLQKIPSVTAMLDGLLNCGRVLHSVVTDDSYKLVVMEDSRAAEVAEMIQNMGFWNDVEAINTLIKVIRSMVEEIEAERPLVGQCLPLWEDLRTKMKDWCAKFSVPEGVVEKIVERRFKKNYHPAWSAAFILDPVYLMRDASGKYLPPFKCLTSEQQKDVDNLITRLVSREEAHIALMELMKWRSDGLDPLYAQAVQVKQRDPFTGKMKIANPQSSRLVWETILKEFTVLGKIAVRLLFLHATSCGFKSNWSFMKWVWAQLQVQSRVGLERVHKMMFVAAHSKLKKRAFGNEEEKEAEFFGTEDDDMLNEVFVDAH
ncbi:putative transcription factor/ chromatin remodeling BED-type(Zn) family [Helianthus annuus]|nr:putative transcription factor/ chromatin remodeling BED-type(Zn) family [Helianthus annuus]KAJ0658178.1 putative transcription factor/ chromatin remodeling BED-type(Zn) family [Helianthus annuus]